MIFSWTDDNVDHIAKHGVSPGEAEYVVRHAKRPFPRSQGDGKMLVWGQTNLGRYLQVIYVYPPDEKVDFNSLSTSDLIEFEAGATVVFVIHAMELTPDQKRRYRKR